MSDDKRYKPIILQEHDAEPIKLRAILDVETDSRHGDWGLDPKIDKFCFNCGAKMVESEEEE